MYMLHCMCDTLTIDTDVLGVSVSSTSMPTVVRSGLEGALRIEEHQKDSVHGIGMAWQRIDLEGGGGYSIACFKKSPVYM